MDGTEKRDDAFGPLSTRNAEPASALTGATDAATPGTAAAKPADPARPSLWPRRALSAALITLGLLSAPVGVLTVWAKSELLDSARFAATVSPLASDPAFQAFLVDEVVAVVDERADLDGIAAELFTGLSTLGLPPRAVAALGLLEGPAVEGVREIIRSKTEEVISSEAFRQVFASSVRTSHAQVVAALRGDTAALLSISASGELGIQLGPIVATVKERLLAQGFTLAERIPAVDRTIGFARSDVLVPAQAGYRLVDSLGLVLPWVSLALVTAGVFVARRRVVVLVRAALGLGLTMAFLAVMIVLGRGTLIAAVAPQYLPPNAARAGYDALTAGLSATILTVGLAALTVALVGYLVCYLTGPTPVGALLRRRATALALPTGADPT